MQRQIQKTQRAGHGDQCKLNPTWQIKGVIHATDRINQGHPAQQQHHRRIGDDQIAEKASRRLQWYRQPFDQKLNRQMRPPSMRQGNRQKDHANEKPLRRLPAPGQGIVEAIASDNIGQNNQNQRDQRQHCRPANDAIEKPENPLSRQP